MRLEITVDATVAKAAVAAMEKALYDAVGKWAYAEALEAMAFSQAIVPIDTGALASSAQVEMPRVEGGVVIVELGYGNSSVDYAWKVHEDLNMPHKPGKEAKFLEKGLLSREGTMFKTLQEAITDVTGK